MKINSQLLKKVFTILSLTLAFLVIFPISVLAASNYGDGTYGGGNYGVGDTPVPVSTTNTSSSGAPSCGDSVTKGVPNLFEIRTTKSTATLYFAPPTMPYSNFYIAYSTKPNIWQYGVQFDQGNSGGVLKYTINKLNPNTKYYFEMRPGNGCMAGNWGNTMTANTTSSTQTKTYYKNIVTTVVQQIKNFLGNLFTGKNTNTPQPTSTAKPLGTQNPTLEPEQTSAPSPKPKFCILWWCF